MINNEIIQDIDDKLEHYIINAYHDYDENKDYTKINRTCNEASKILYSNKTKNMEHQFQLEQYITDEIKLLEFKMDVIAEYLPSDIYKYKNSYAVIKLLEKAYHKSVFMLNKKQLAYFFDHLKHYHTTRKEWLYEELLRTTWITPRNKEKSRNHLEKNGQIHVLTALERKYLSDETILVEVDKRYYYEYNGCLGMDHGFFVINKKDFEANQEREADTGLGTALLIKTGII